MKKIIISEIIYLDRLQEKDLQRLQMLADEEWMRAKIGDDFPSPYTLDDAKWWLEHSNKKIEEWWHRYYAIYIDGEYAWWLWYEIKEWWWRKRHNYHLGYWIWKPFRKKWYMTQIVAWVCEYVFNHHNDCHRMYAKVFWYNPASRRVLEKCWFKLEATLKEAVYRENERHNERVLWLLRDDK